MKFRNVKYEWKNFLLSGSLPFQYLEWFFVSVHIVLQLSYSQGISGFKVGIVVVLMFLSFIFPAGRTYSQKAAYLCLAISILVYSKFIGFSLDLLLYLYIAKSCFLLDSKGVFCTVILTGVAWVAGEYVSEVREYLAESGSLEPIFQFEPPYGFGVFSPRILAIYALCIYLAASIFIIVFSYLVLAEQKSRQQAEALTHQVETLAASLERARIARDIHDSLGHTLTDLDMQLEVAQALRYVELDQAFQAMDNAKMLSKQCIEDVSQAIQMLRGPQFDLQRSLKELVEQIKQHQSIQVYLEMELPTLSAYLKHQLYCILKEGLVNVQKHARASSIRIKGHANHSKLLVVLQDDGVGFVPGQVKSGFGLKGMTERAQLLGGELKVRSTLGRGTCIEIMLPL